MEIRKLISREDLTRAFLVMRELRTHLSERQYFDLLETMTGEGYELIALLDEDEIKALAGIAYRTNFYYGKYCWVFDLITKESDRSRGYGRSLLGHIEEAARDRGCDVVALSSGLQRTDAHRFYETTMGYDKTSFTFKKSLRI